MENPNQAENSIRLNDTSQMKVYGISQGENVIRQLKNVEVSVNKSISTVIIDKEVENLLNWLAEQQGISPEIALKKAVVTAAYLHDLTTSEGGELLVKRKDNSVGKIVLK
ncbi:hypothetical protein [Crocosphaera sp. XPORK-15E]|uniref:hypothetical protein n=1 Tax=Crocosphaera sp. XPORK-15E TaxID=3110247 RepID=UPI002B213358|nr:hypothetical protein [Crocosphaera sp. XPORK-15E]MEA5533449.1 hypothetical protein [Crocosphaera sp. XPORK-15E]